MKTIPNVIKFLILTTMLLGCETENKPIWDGILAKVASAQSSVSAKPYVESNEMLELDINFKDSNVTYNLSDIEIAKLKAAVFRFYSTVKIIDNNYTTHLKNPEEINISADLFHMFIDNLDEMNNYINKLKSKSGQEGTISVQRVTPEYLNSLLK